jgi:hypothetical protein
MDKKNCLQKEAGAKKLFATTTTPKKIVCVDEMSITCCVIKIKN